MDMYLLKYPYRKILRPIAEKLGWIHPDIVSYTAVLVTIGTGWCFYKSTEHNILLIVAIVLILLRMTLNTLDGVLAIRRGNLSLKGEIVNALPDRYSDVFMLAGIALSSLCRDWVGITAVCTMLLVSYTGMLGKALSVSWQHHGPMGKVERLVIIMIFALVQFIVLPERQNVSWLGISATPMEWAMGIISILGQYTVLRRLNGQLREIKYKETIERLDLSRNRERVVVLYDSATGNTRKVAEGIAQGLGCTAISISEVSGIDTYEMIVIGTPNIRKCPTSALQKFQRENPASPSHFVTFSTFGMPLWGHMTVRSCMKSMAKAWNTKTIASFSCPGYHQKYRLYKGRPNEKDLLSAFLFGLKLSRKLKKNRKG